MSAFGRVRARFACFPFEAGDAAVWGAELELEGRAGARGLAGLVCGEAAPARAVG